MDFLKDVFGEEALTFEQFTGKVTGKGLKLADLSTGGYVDKKKFDDAVSTKDTSIADLQKQLTERDNDLKNLKAQLADGTKDNETKIADLTSQVTKLQTDYKTAKQEWETKLNEQAYNFAVREYAGTKQFTSEAAQRDFISQMLAAKLTLDGNTIIGATDFETKYRAENAKAFVVDNPDPNNNEGGADPNKKPLFIQPSAKGSAPAQTEEQEFLKAFGFTNK